MLNPLHEATDPVCVGGKAAVLAQLVTAGIRIPAGVVLPVGSTVTSELVAELCTWAEAHAPYGIVVRSSAPVEDGAHASFAGLFTSCFAPCRPDVLAAAVRAVLASSSSDVVIAYQHARGLDTVGRLKIAVLVQAALRPVAAGVAFTDRDGGTRIEATWGLSSLLLAGHTSPDVVAVGAGGAVSVRQVAEKILTSVPATATELDIPPGNWITVPELGWLAKLVHADPGQGLLYLSTPEQYARTCCVPAEAASVVQATAQRVAAVLGYPGVDLEWVLDAAGQVHVVQARRITRPLPPARNALASDSPVCGRVWRGVSASVGQVTGPTRVHRGAARLGEFPDGHILVTSSAGPELMPALIACGGVIATDSGALCHTAIVARELGTPCVVGLHDALTDFPTGTLVYLDGTAGTVTIVNNKLSARPQPATIGGNSQECLWRIVATYDDLTEADRPPAHLIVLVPDAVVLDELAADPTILDRWHAAGVVALLLPAGHPALPGTATVVPLPGAGDLHWIIALPSTSWPASLVVIAASGEVLFRATLPDNDLRNKGVLA